SCSSRMVASAACLAIRSRSSCTGSSTPFVPDGSAISLLHFVVFSPQAAGHKKPQLRRQRALFLRGELAQIGKYFRPKVYGQRLANRLGRFCHGGLFLKLLRYAAGCLSAPQRTHNPTLAFSRARYRSPARPCQPRRAMSAIGGRPADICSLRGFLILT